METRRAKIFRVIVGALGRGKSRSCLRRWPGCEALSCSRRREEAESHCITRSASLPRRLRIEFSDGIHRVGTRLLALICILAAGISFAQTLTFRPIKDFKVPDYYPNPTPGGTNQLKSLLTGVTARPRPDGRAFVTGARIEHYSPAGQTQMVVRAVDCIFEYKTKLATSTNTIQFQTADGKFYLEGVGFLWDQTNSNLVISNKIRTVMSRPLVDTAVSSVKPAKP